MRSVKNPGESYSLQFLSNNVIYNGIINQYLPKPEKRSHTS